MGNLKNNQCKLKQEDKNDNFKDVWDGSVFLFKTYVEKFFLYSRGAAPKSFLNSWEKES